MKTIFSVVQYRSVPHVVAWALTGLLMSTSLAFAEDGPPGSAAAQSFVAKLNEVILLPLVALLMGVALLVFLYGCFEYIRGANNATAREQGAKHITYGVIGLVIMISAWAILELAAGTFGLTGELDCATDPSAVGCEGSVGPGPGGPPVGPPPG